MVKSFSKVKFTTLGGTPVILTSCPDFWFKREGEMCLCNATRGGDQITKEVYITSAPTKTMDEATATTTTVATATTTALQ